MKIIDTKRRGVSRRVRATHQRCAAELRRSASVSEANSIELKADAFLKKIKQLKLDRLIAISAIDVGSNFDLLYHFSHKNEIVEIKVILAKTKPIIDSIIDLYPSSQLYERETHDFFGIEFIGNPNLHDKLFLPDNWNEEPPLINKNA